MKTKHYEFTESELYTLRDAMIEYWQMIRKLESESPIAIENQQNAKALKEQFAQDAILM